MDAATGGLGGDDAGFVLEHLFPTGGDFGLGGHFVGEFEEDLVVAEFGGEEGFVEGGEFGVRGGAGEDGEAFAGAGFDEGGDAEAVEGFSVAAGADEGAEFGGVEAFVPALHAAAAFHEEAGDLGEVGSFVAGDTGHGFDPAGGPLVGPAGHEFHGVLGGLHFEEGVVDEEGDGVGEGGWAPFDGGAGAEGELVDFGEDIGGHPFKLAIGGGD
jgi:hypothetical protein